ncbi:MAG TPA: LLM class flavin-dependent oxidoreductase [Candidatus Methylomirabilis sp.]|nr:LLM class flavin-dependent oxidoreductase [Candidatus Methylomirabilis sp.]
MKTDLLLIPMGARYHDMRAAAIAAEEAGFDGVWTWDHLRDPDGGARSRVPESWTVLTALAEATRRIALGPLVLNVSSRHPGMLANMAATLQEISGGRLLLGLGAGAHRRLPYAIEHEALGIAVEPDRIRAERVAEAAQVLRQLWSGDASTFAGTHYRLERPTGFLRPDPPPPIIVGGFGPRMAGIAGRFADGFNTQAAHPRLDELIQIARDAHAATGREPGRFIVTVFGGFREAYVDPAAPARASLERRGVERLILLLEPPYDLDRVRKAARLLGAR